MAQNVSGHHRKRAGICCGGGSSVDDNAHRTHTHTP